MRISIRGSYLFSFLFLTASVISLLHFYGMNTIKSTLLKDKETALYKEANYITQEYSFDIPSLSDPENDAQIQLRLRLKSLQIMTDTRFWVTDRQGLIIVDSSSSANREGININRFDSSLLKEPTFTGRTSHHLLSEEIFAVIYPLSSDLQTSGYLVLSISMNNLNNKARHYITAIYTCFIIFLLLLLLVFLYLKQKTLRPLRLMTETVKAYSNGNFEQNDKINSPREFIQLAAAVDYLAAKTKNLNDSQKEFIANVSHDFRSPLTSIKGYTEAMLDGTIPPEIQEKYLKIILFETKRLTKLTDSLLKLNQFEANGLILEMTTFDINKTIKNTTSAFEQMCTEKKISIQLIFTQKSLPVVADSNAIEQVLQNLIDNAIKFSPPESDIRISTVPQGGKVFVSIKDFGTGIPKDNLAKIWERFYKTDPSRGRHKTGTGLGLSITKEIIKAHHEHINVVSTEGVGTEFTFSLKAYEE